MEQVARKKKYFASRKKELIFAIGMVILPMIQFVIFWGYVSFDSILMAFKDGKGAWSLVHFESFVRDYQKGLIATALKNSMINLAVAEFVTLPLVISLSYLLFKKCYGASAYRVLFFLPSLISAVVMANLFSSLVTPVGDNPGAIISLLQKLGVSFSDEVLNYGLLGPKQTAFTTVEVFCVWTGVGTNLVLLCGGLSRAPADLFEAAKIDGAGMWKEFTVIVIPILWPTITTLFIFNLAGCFTMYQPVMLLTENNENTITIGYFIMKRTAEANGKANALGYPAAVGLIFTAVTVPIILFVKWSFNKISGALEF